jgi:hypothetical protein
MSRNSVDPKRSVFIEDCAESFPVIAQAPAMPFREVSDFGFT